MKKVDWWSEEWSSNWDLMNWWLLREEEVMRSYGFVKRLDKLKDEVRWIRVKKGGD